MIDLKTLIATLIALFSFLGWVFSQYQTLDKRLDDLTTRIIILEQKECESEK